MTKQAKLIPLSRVRGKVELDTIKHSKHSGNRRAFDVLMEAQSYWDAMRRFRDDRERNKRYCYGDQWRDVIEVDGKSMTEEDYIKSQGNVPLKNNLIRRLVRNVIGVHRSQNKEPSCVARDRDEQRLAETMSTMLQTVMHINKMDELYARTMEEYLISGFAVHKKWYGWRDGRCEAWTDIVQPNNFFIDSNMRDVRGWDVSCCGEVHDISFQELCNKFARSNADCQRFATIYKNATDKSLLAKTVEEFGYSNPHNIDFLFSADHTRCRVIEVWRKESKPRYRCHDWNSGELYIIDNSDYHDMVVLENQDRIQRGFAAGLSKDDIPLIDAEWYYDNYWYCYLLSPFGDILDEYESPYNHKSHPYVFKAYPFIDGEIHSFVGDVLDQQRYTNRLVTMHDWIMRASVKGVLLFPEDCLPDGTSIEDIADEWTRFNGVLMIKAKPGVPLPQQVSNNATNIGISELLNLQLKFFEDISGVNGALQGKPGYSSTSGTLYQQQTQNATISLLDIQESLSSFIVDAAWKDVKLIQQYYDDKRQLKIAGKNAFLLYEPDKQRNIEYDINICEIQVSPDTRQRANELLMTIWQSGQITLTQLLEHGDFPFADDLLQSIKSQQEQMQQAQQVSQLSPELQQQAQQGADMDAVNQAYQMLRA